MKSSNGKVRLGLIALVSVAASIFFASALLTAPGAQPTALRAGWSRPIAQAPSACGGAISPDQAVATTTSASGSKKVTLGFPGSVAAGDVCIAGFSIGNSLRNVTVGPAGWTLIRHDKTGRNGADAFLYRYTSLGGGSDPANFTWSVNKSSGGYAGWIQCFSGVSTNTPIDPNNPAGSGARAFAAAVNAPALAPLAQSGEEIVL